VNFCTQLIFKVDQLTIQVNQTMTLSMAINSIITCKEERRYITASSNQSHHQQHECHSSIGIEYFYAGFDVKSLIVISTGF